MMWRLTQRINGARFFSRALLFTCLLTGTYGLGLGLAVWRHEAYSAAYFKRTMQIPVLAHLEVPVLLRWMTPGIETGHPLDSFIRHYRYPTWMVEVTGDWRADALHAAEAMAQFPVVVMLATVAVLAGIRRLPLTWVLHRFRSATSSDLRGLRARWRVLCRVRRSSWILLMLGACTLGLSTAFIGDAAAIVVGRLQTEHAWREWLSTGGANSPYRKPSYRLDYIRVFGYDGGGFHPFTPLAVPDAAWLFTGLVLVHAMIVAVPARDRLLQREVHLNIRCSRCMYPRSIGDRAAPCSECGSVPSSPTKRVGSNMKVTLIFMTILGVSLLAFVSAPLLGRY